MHRHGVLSIYFITFSCVCLYMCLCVICMVVCLCVCVSLAVYEHMRVIARGIRFQ